MTEVLRREAPYFVNINGLCSSKSFRSCSIFENLALKYLACYNFTQSPHGWNIWDKPQKSYKQENKMVVEGNQKAAVHHVLVFPFKRWFFLFWYLPFLWVLWRSVSQSNISSSHWSPRGLEASLIHLTAYIERSCFSQAHSTNIWTQLENYHLRSRVLPWQFSCRCSFHLHQKPRNHFKITENLLYPTEWNCISKVQENALVFFSRLLHSSIEDLRK